MQTKEEAHARIAESPPNAGLSNAIACVFPLIVSAHEETNMNEREKAGAAARQRVIIHRSVAV